jgi:cell division protein FtsZ
VINPELEDQVLVTVIATGFESTPSQSQPRPQQAREQARAEAAATQEPPARPRAPIYDDMPVNTSNAWDIPAFMRRRDGRLKGR